MERIKDEPEIIPPYEPEGGEFWTVMIAGIIAIIIYLLIG